MKRRLVKTCLALALLGLVATAAHAAEWAPNTAYSVGTVVTYQGPAYRCLQSHTSLLGWEPPVTPALWQLQSGTPGPTNTPTPTPTTGPGPTATPTPTPVPGGTTFEAEGGSVSGATRRSSCGGCSGGQKVTFIGNGAANFLTINVGATTSGSRTMNIFYLVSGTRTIFYSINGGAGVALALSGSSFSSVAPPRAVTINLNAGSNTIRFFNNSAFTPDLDRITVTGAGGGTPTPTPTRTPVGTTPTPTPTRTPTPCGNCGGPHYITGYWQNFNNGATVVKLRNVPRAYNLIAVAFADNAGGGSITFNLDPALGYSGTSEFIGDISTLRSQGRKVILSVGGQNGTISVADSASANNFANTTVALMNQYGFDGVDIDLENGVNPQFMAQALHSIAARRPGAIIAMAPETLYMQNTNSTYFDLALRVKDVLTVVNTQFYNSGAMLGCDGKVYSQGTVDFLTALACTQLQGGLRPDQVGLGLPASPSGAGSGYVSPTVVNNALDCLSKGTNCGSFRPPRTWPGIRGAMTWSINWDASNGYNWVNTVNGHIGQVP